MTTGFPMITAILVLPSKTPNSYHSYHNGYSIKLSSLSFTAALANGHPDYALH